MPESGEGAAIASDHEIAAAHAPAQRFAAIAFDDDLAAFQALPDIVEAQGSALEPDRLNAAAGADFEKIAHCHFFARGLQFDLRDLLGGFASEQMRDERREVEPLIGLLLEGEDERFHGSRSFR